MDQRIQYAIALIEQACTAPDGLRRILQAVQLSPSHFEYLFKQEMGRTYKSYQHWRRMAHAQALLTEGRLTIKQIADQLGYTHPPNFVRAFKTQFGKTPTQYRRAALETSGSNRGF